MHWTSNWWLLRVFLSISTKFLTIWRLTISDFFNSNIWSDVGRQHYPSCPCLVLSGFFEKTMSVDCPAWQGRDRAVRTFGVLVRRRLHLIKNGFLRNRPKMTETALTQIWWSFYHIFSVYPSKFNEIDSTESCETDSLTSEDESEKNPNINMILWYVRQRKSSIFHFLETMIRLNSEMSKNLVI